MSDHPTIHTISDVWCWVNTWGDIRKHTHFSEEQKQAYERAMSDTLKALGDAGIRFDTVDDDAWYRWRGVG